MASPADQEEVYSLLLTDIDKGIVDEAMVKEYYHDHLLKSEIGKVISVDFDQTKANAIVKVKVKAAAAGSLLEEVQGNLKERDRPEKVKFLYTESSTLTLNWNPLMKSVASGIVDYARKHYPMVIVKDIEGVHITISGTVHDVLSLQHQYTKLVAGRLVPAHTSNSEAVSRSDSIDRTEAAATEITASDIKEYPNLNPDVLVLLKKMPEGKIPGIQYHPKRGCISLDSCSADEENARISSFQDKYRELTTSRKMKVDAVVIPEELSDFHVKEMVSSFDTKYSQCAFVFEEDPRAVRVISNSSRQFEQAKKILKDNLQEALNKGKAGATSGTPSVSESTTIQICHGRTLRLKKADIVLEDVDIIVNAANGSLEHGGGVAGAINRASNGEVQKHSYKYTRSNGRLQEGQVALTQAGGSLKCKHIIHAVGPMKSVNNKDMCERLLFDVMKNILKRAEKCGARSISIPAISSGIFGVGAELVARCITESITGFKFRKPPPVVSDIRIVIIDQPTHQCFAKYFAKKIATLPAASNPGPEEDKHKVLSQPKKASTSPGNTSPAVKLPTPPLSPAATGPSSLPGGDKGPMSLPTTTKSPLSLPDSASSSNVNSGNGKPFADGESSLRREAPHSDTAAISEASTFLEEPHEMPYHLTTTAIGGTTYPKKPHDVIPANSPDGMPTSEGTTSSTVPSYAMAVKMPKDVKLAEERPVPVDSNDVVFSVAQVLIHIADRWYMLGRELGFNVEGLDKLKADNPNKPTFDLMLTVLRSKHDSLHGDTPKFVNALISALQSPIVGAQHFASIVAHMQGFTVRDSTGKVMSDQYVRNLTPTDATIVRPLLQGLAEKWHIIGGLLGFDKDALIKISSFGGSDESYLNIIITKWLCGDSSQPPTLESLITALKYINEGDTVTKLLKMYTVNSTNTATIINEQPMMRGHIRMEVILPFLTNISSKWDSLAIALGARNEDLVKIQGESENCLQKVISLWLSGKCRSEPTLESLLSALRSPTMSEVNVAMCIEQELLKKTLEEDQRVGGDGSGICYPSLPSSDEEGAESDEIGGKKSGKRMSPPPDFGAKRIETSVAPPLLRSLSDSNASSVSSLVTTNNGSQLGGGHPTDKHLKAANRSGRVKSKLAPSFDSPANCGDIGNKEKVKSVKSSSSNAKGINSLSKKSHGDARRCNHTDDTAGVVPKSPKTTEKCVICLEEFKDPFMTKCNHKFCRECIYRAMEASPYCPVCKVALRKIVGHQPPNGTMSYQYMKMSLPGYEGYNTIQITYNIPDGTQGQNHPNPGERYRGTIRVAYLPDTMEGQEVLKLLRKAFDARLIFTVGRSVTTGTDNVVVWNDIHHKTVTSGHPFGYPDPTYLQRVKEELAAKGIVPDTAV